MSRLARRIAVLAVALAATTALLPAPPAGATAVIDCGKPCRIQSVDTVCWESNDCPVLIVVEGKILADVTLVYRTRDGKAVAPADYVPVREGKVVLRPGDTKAEVTMVLRADGLVEPNETFFLQFYGVDGGKIVAETVTVTVLDGHP